MAKAEGEGLGGGRRKHRRRWKKRRGETEMRVEDPWRGKNWHSKSGRSNYLLLCNHPPQMQRLITMPYLRGPGG